MNALTSGPHSDRSLRGLSRLSSRWHWAPVALLTMLSACTVTPSTINYSQVGTCYANGPDDPSTLYYWFKLESIDSSHTAAAYTFLPSRLEIIGVDKNSYDPVATAQQTYAYGLPGEQAPIPVAANSTVAVNKYVIFVAPGPVSTFLLPAPEPTTATFFLRYNSPPGEVGKILNRTNPLPIQFPVTHSCNQIRFQR